MIESHAVHAIANFYLLRSRHFGLILITSFVQNLLLALCVASICAKIFRFIDARVQRVSPNKRASSGIVPSASGVGVGVYEGISEDLALRFWARRRRPTFAHDLRSSSEIRFTGEFFVTVC